MSSGISGLKRPFWRQKVQLAHQWCRERRSREAGRTRGTSGGSWKILSCSVAGTSHPHPACSIAKWHPWTWASGWSLWLSKGGRNWLPAEVLPCSWRPWSGRRRWTGPRSCPRSWCPWGRCRWLRRRTLSWNWSSCWWWSAGTRSGSSAHRRCSSEMDTSQSWWIQRVTNFLPLPRYYHGWQTHFHSTSKDYWVVFLFQVLLPVLRLTLEIPQ